jgi:hypothetical protein
VLSQWAREGLVRFAIVYELTGDGGQEFSDDSRTPDFHNGSGTATPIPAASDGNPGPIGGIAKPKSPRQDAIAARLRPGGLKAAVRHE